jgi:hypothetical protein
MNRTRVGASLGLTAILVVGLAGSAFAAPITFTQSQRFTDDFTGSFPCQTELYHLTVSGREYTPSLPGPMAMATSSRRCASTT